MASITTRAGKGSPLTNAEVDANFTNLNAAVPPVGCTAGQVLSKIDGTDYIARWEHPTIARQTDEQLAHLAE